MDKKGGNVASGANLASKPYNAAASKAEKKVARMTIKADIGLDAVGGSVNGIKYCSPRAFVKMKNKRLARVDIMEINKPNQTVLLSIFFRIDALLDISVNDIPGQLFKSLPFLPGGHIYKNMVDIFHKESSVLER